MGKKIKLEDIDTGEKIIVDEDNCRKFTPKELIMTGYFGRKEMYKYLKEHPGEIENEKLFSDLEKEFKDDDIT